MVEKGFFFARIALRVERASCQESHLFIQEFLCCRSKKNPVQASLGYVPSHSQSKVVTKNSKIDGLKESLV
jgi:hypothetical protein